MGQPWGNRPCKRSCIFREMANEPNDWGQRPNIQKAALYTYFSWASNKQIELMIFKCYSTYKAEGRPNPKDMSSEESFWFYNVIFIISLNFFRQVWGHKNVVSWQQNFSQHNWHRMRFVESETNQVDHWNCTIYHQFKPYSVPANTSNLTRVFPRVFNTSRHIIIFQMRTIPPQNKWAI